LARPGGGLIVFVLERGLGRKLGRQFRALGQPVIGESCVVPANREHPSRFRDRFCPLSRTPASTDLPRGSVQEIHCCILLHGAAVSCPFTSLNERTSAQFCDGVVTHPEDERSFGANGEIIAIEIDPVSWRRCARYAVSCGGVDGDVYVFGVLLGASVLELGNRVFPDRKMWAFDSFLGHPNDEDNDFDGHPDWKQVSEGARMERSEERGPS